MAGKSTLTITDNRTGQDVRAARRERDDPRHGPAQDQGRRERLRPHDLRPGVHEHGVVQVGDHVHRRRQGDPRIPGLPDRGAGREVDVPRGRVAPPEGRAADGRRAEGVHEPRHDAHVPPRERQEAHGGLPARRPPDGDAALDRRRALDVLPGRQADLRREVARPPHRPAHREDAHDRGLRVPAFHRLPVRLPGQRALLHGQLPVDDEEDGRAAVRREPGPRAGARRPLHPSRRPRAELLDERDALASARRRPTRTRPSRPPPRRSTGRFTAARTRPSSGCSTSSATSRTSRPS